MKKKSEPPSTRNSKVPRLRYFTALAMAMAASTIFRRSAGFEAGAGRQLDDLLAAPLQGAFALAQRHDAALAVADDLHLDVAGLARSAARHRDRRCRRPTCASAEAAREGIGDLAFVRDQPHAAPAAAGDRLERDARLRHACRRTRVAPATSIAPSVPGSTGTLLFAACARARALSPNSSSCSGVGPTKAIPPRRRRWRRRHSRTGSRSPDGSHRSRPPCAAAMMPAMSR